MFDSSVYFHCGKPHFVKHVDLNELRVYMEYAPSVSYITIPDHSVKASPIKAFGCKNKISFGLVQVSCRIIQYFKYDPVKKKITEAVRVDGKPFDRQCNAIWFTIPSDCLDELEMLEININDCLDALANATIRQILAVVGATTLAHVKEGNNLTIYSKSSHDEWIQNLFDEMDQFICQTFNRIHLCECTNGCIRCTLPVYSHQIEGYVKEVDPLAKRGALIILRYIQS